VKKKGSLVKRDLRCVSETDTALIAEAGAPSDGNNNEDEKEEDAAGGDSTETDAVPRRKL